MQQGKEHWQGRNLLVQTMAVVLVACAMMLWGCAPQANTPVSGSAGASASASASAMATSQEPPVIEGLTFDHAMDLQYADRFAVYYYDGGFKVIRVVDDVDYLLVPEGASAPAKLPKGMTVMQGPLDSIYLCATATASLFDAIDSLDTVKFTGTTADSWSIDCMRNAVNDGSIAYAGKYSAPDYERLVSGRCDLALESTMILHAPEVQEAIEKLDIPVFIEHSSFEGEPMGRVEWVKAIGALIDREDAAQAYFDEQAKVMTEMEQYANTDKTVAYFSVNSTGQVIVRRPGDFVAKSINIAGGKYAFPDLDDSGTMSTLKMSMEQFYATAVNVDYLVYNGTIEASLSSIQDLVDLDATFADYKAVREGHVWTVDKDMYQSTDKIAAMIEDFHILVTDGAESDMTFLHKVN